MTDIGHGRPGACPRFSALAFCAVFFLLCGSAVGTVGAQPDCEEVNYVKNPSGELLVGNVDELQCMTDGVTEDYKLAGDIDASGTEEWNNGSGFDPVGPTFRGTFDGDGYTVSGLTVNRGNSSGAGLFSSVSLTSSVENVHIEDVNITGGENVGGLVGENLGEVTDVSVTGEVTCEGDAVGGVVGRNIDGTVVQARSEADVEGELHVGGLVGRNTGEVSESFATGDVNGDTNVGGLVGYNLIEIRNTYATGKVEGRVTIGGLVGQNRGNGEVRKSYAVGMVDGAEAGGLIGLNDDAVVESSYFDRVTTGERDRGRRGTVGVGLVTEQMTGESARGNMTGLNFDGMWEVKTDDYPVLAWQVIGSEGDEDSGGDDGTSVGSSEVDEEESEEEEESTDGDGVGDEGVLTTEEPGDGGENVSGDRDYDGNGTGGSEEGGEGMPGFGFLVGFLAFLGVAGVSRRFPE